MKKLPIRMLTSICGPDYDLQTKQVTDRFSVAEAIRLIDSGQAVPVNPGDYETATRKAPERRTAGAPKAKAKARSAVKVMSDAIVEAITGKARG